MPEQPPGPEPIGHAIASNVVPDKPDDRDLVFVPDAAKELPAEVGFDRYKQLADETWHQRGEECTGFALAAIANYLVRSRPGGADAASVSRRMLYEMAQVYDDRSYVEGSTLRGALKGWSRVGVASDNIWPYHPDDEHGAVHGGLTLARVLDGRKRPLRRYRRIAEEEVETTKRALAEGHVVYAAARFHEGWYRLSLHDSNAVIERRSDDKPKNVHAFVIVGYNQTGFWIHNSWGPEWGNDGYALLPYSEWEWGRTDAWVADAGIDAVAEVAANVPTESDAESAKRVYRDMWPHLVVLQDDGRVASTGLYEMDKGSVDTLLYLFDEYTKANQWSDKKLAIIADGGMFSPAATIERLQPLRDRLLRQRIYPIFLVWQTPWYRDLETELRTWIADGARSNATADDELQLRLAAASAGGKAAWNAIAERASQACAAETAGAWLLANAPDRKRLLANATGGARLVANAIAYKRGQRFFDLHVVSFGVGDLLASSLTPLLASPVNSVLTIASATSLDRAQSTYLDMLECGCLEHLRVVTFDEQADAADRFAGTEWSLLDVISTVWGLAGSDMRRAVRAARVSGEWDAPAVPLLGLSRDVTDRRLAHWEQIGRLSRVAVAGASHRDVHIDSNLHDVILDELTRDRPALAVDSAAAEPRRNSDPLARAEARHRAGWRGAGAD